MGLFGFGRKDQFLKLLEACSDGGIHAVHTIQDAVSKGVNLNSIDSTGKTLLLTASFYGHSDIVRLLIEKGADVNLRSTITALMGASNRGHVDVVKILLERNAQLEARSENGMTALMFASQGGYANIVKLLLDKGANVNSKMEDGTTALKLASDKGYADVVTLLLQGGAEVGCEGMTALICASKGGHAGIVKLLLDKGANINTKTKDGATALIWAAAAGHVDVTKILLENGVCVDVATDEGRTAMDCAKLKGYKEIVQLLKNAGAKQGQRKPITFKGKVVRYTSSDDKLIQQIKKVQSGKSKFENAEIALQGVVDILHVGLQHDNKHLSRRDVEQLVADMKISDVIGIIEQAIQQLALEGD